MAVSYHSTAGGQWSVVEPWRLQRGADIYRLIVLALALMCLIGTKAEAACVGTQCPSPSYYNLSVQNQTTFGSVQWIYATLPAYPAPIDTILANYLALCTSMGTKLILPAGIFLMNASHAPPVLQNCVMEGADLPASLFGFAKPGTLIELTGNPGATTPPVFYLEKGFTVRGISFYWPNQTGAVVYPPLFADNGTVGTPGNAVNRGEISNVRIMNAYDGIVQVNAQWGDVRFENLETFAAHDNFRISSVGDGMIMNNVRIDPGPLQGFCGSCDALMGAMSHTATAFHVLAPPSGAGGVPFNLNAQNLVVVGARYGFLLESGSVVGETQVSATWDVVGTIIDSSSGGLWAAGNTFVGQNANCATPPTVWGDPVVGNAPCFNMGTTGELTLNGFQSAGVRGDFIKTLGATVTIQNSVSDNIGGVADGADYYQINYAGAAGGVVRAQGNQFHGGLNDAHLHGFGTTGSGPPGYLIFQNNLCEYTNQCVGGMLPLGASITGNTSLGTKAGLFSFGQSNANPIIYNNNNWDRPPLATLGACGIGCTFSGAATANVGIINLGTGIVTSATFTLPFALLGRCIVQTDGVAAVGVTMTGTPATVHTDFSTDLAGFHLFYNCPGTP